jgi:hypothetical protein
MPYACMSTSAERAGASSTPQLQAGGQEGGPAHIPHSTCQPTQPLTHDAVFKGKLCISGGNLHAALLP